MSMTQTSTEATEYGMYGDRQDEFSYLGPEPQAEIIRYCHGIALMMHEARGMAVVVTTTDGFEITRAMLDAEIAQTRAAQRLTRTLAPMTTTDPFYTGFHGVGHFA